MIDEVEQLNLVEVCPICGSRNIILETILPDVKYFKCSGCQVYFKKKIDDDVAYISRDYNFHYKENHKDLIVKTFYELLRFQRINGMGYHSFLDIGGGTGSSLIAARRLGYECNLCEVNKPARDIALKNNTADRIYSNLAEINSQLLVFDLIFSSHTLEHVSDPVDFIKRTYLALREGGSAIFILPFLDSYLKHDKMLRLLPSKLHMNIVHYFFSEDHNFLWTSRSLVSFLEKAGFKDIHVYPAFSLRKIYFPNIKSKITALAWPSYEAVFNIGRLLGLSTAMTIVCKK